MSHSVNASGRTSVYYPEEAPTIEWDGENRIAEVTISANRTMGLPDPLLAGTYLLVVKQDATGGYTMSWASGYKWAGGSAPTITTTANAIDVLSFISDGASMYGAVQQNMS